MTANLLTLNYPNEISSHRSLTTC